MAPLNKLIRQRMEELRLSYAELARRADLPMNTVYAYVNRPDRRQPPRHETLKKLAHGLDLPVRVLQLATAVSVGLVIDEPIYSDETNYMANVIERMTPEHRSTLRCIAVALAAQGQDATRRSTLL